MRRAASGIPALAKAGRRQAEVRPRSGQKATFFPFSRIAKIAGIYLAVAALWVMFSDHLVALAFRDPALLTLAQTCKGWLFVVGAAALIYFLLKREIAT